MQACVYDNSPVRESQSAVAFGPFRVGIARYCRHEAKSLETNSADLRTLRL